ncbi:hypothetical protein LEP1GSC170_4970, partial [Leptospira interrogans serovar Bataviae str. HAI135]
AYIIRSYTRTFLVGSYIYNVSRTSLLKKTKNLGL